MANNIESTVLSSRVRLARNLADYPFPSALKSTAQAKEIIRSGIPFDGVVCGEDTTAIGVMKGLKKQGYRVPEDVAVTGCNNSPEAQLCEPELTTLDNKPELLGGMCARLLRDTIEKKASAVSVAIQPELVVRQST